MKERLTGAIILVALLVLLVPELLTGPEHVKMAAPAGIEGTQMRSYTIDLQDGAANRQPPASAPAIAASDDPVGQATPEDEGASPPTANVAPPVDDAARATSRPMGSGADSSAAASEAAAPASAAAKRGAVATPPGHDDEKPRSAFGPSADAARTEAAKAQAAKAAAAKPEGAKSEAAKSESEKTAAAKAEAQKAEAAKADAARAEAAKAEPAKARAAKAEAERAAASKSDATKVAKAESPKPDATRVAAAKVDTPKAAGSKGWAVQLGVFGSRDNAERLAKQVKGSGFPVLVNETAGKDGKKLYWVRVGPEAEAAAADALSAKLKAAGHRDARVVSYP